MDKETEAFAAKVLLSIQQAKRGEFARVHAPGDIAAYKARGRPRLADAGERRHARVGQGPSGGVMPKRLAKAAQSALPPKSTALERAALLRKALSFRMTTPYGKKFERKDAYGH